MKAYIIYIATLLAAFALPTQAQTTKAQPGEPSFPYLADTLLSGGRHGTLTLSATIPGTDSGSSTEYIALPGSMAYAKASVKIAIVPGNGYKGRPGYPKVYKTGTPATTVAVTENDSRTFTFIMPAHPVTIEMAYAGLLKNIKTDSLTLKATVSTAADIIKLLPAKQPVHLQNDAIDSLAVAANSWALKAGTTFKTAEGAVNEFTCTLTLPDSILQNGVTLTGTIRVTNHTIPPVTSIASEADLKAFRETVNQGKDYTDLTVFLTASFALTEASWTPIGNYNKNFTGTFDGQGFVISGLKVSIQEGADAYAGLFGYISATATVKNLGVTGNVTGNAPGRTVYAGGIAGQSNGMITNCYTNVTVNATGNLVYAGGIVGQMATATVSNCFATGNCTTTATAYAGGIVGYKNNGSLSYCYATGTVEAKGDATNKYTGGIAGNNTSTLTGCIALNTGGITGDAARTNRVVGTGSKNITDCYASPLIPGTWGNIGDTAQSGADLTIANFISANSAFAGEWTTAGNWKFTTNDFTHLPTLLTTGLTENKEVGIQTAIKRTDCLALVRIDKAVAYDAALHKDKYILITSDGILTVGAADAQVGFLEIQEGGQLKTTAALSVNRALTTSRTLANQWITFGTPVGMTPKYTVPTNSIYVRTGYTEAKYQSWNGITIPATLLANTPYLLAAENAGTALTLTADKPVTIPVFKEAETGGTLNNGIFLFRMNPSLCNQTLTNIYVLSNDGYRFELQETAYDVKPFECYLIANAATRAAIKSLHTGGDLPTGNTPVVPTTAFRIWGAGGQLHLDATTAPADVVIYSLSGQLLHRFRLDGNRTLTLARGIYLVRSNNITYKVSL